MYGLKLEEGEGRMEESSNEITQEGRWSRRVKVKLSLCLTN
jgi:hypothetical protein